MPLPFSACWDTFFTSLTKCPKPLPSMKPSRTLRKGSWFHPFWSKHKIPDFLIYCFTKISITWIHIISALNYIFVISSEFGMSSYTIISIFPIFYSIYLIIQYHVKKKGYLIPLSWFHGPNGTSNCPGVKATTLYSEQGRTGQQHLPSFHDWTLTPIPWPLAVPLATGCPLSYRTNLWKDSWFLLLNALYWSKDTHLQSDLSYYDLKSLWYCSHTPLFSSSVYLALH